MVSCMRGVEGRASRLVSAGLRPLDQSQASGGKHQRELARGGASKSGNQEEVWWSRLSDALTAGLQTARECLPPKCALTCSVCVYCSFGSVVDSSVPLKS